MIYLNLPWFTSIYHYLSDLLQFTMICLNIAQLAIIWLNLPKFTTIYLNLPWFTSIYNDFPQFTSICHDIHLFTMNYINLPWYTSICLKLPWFTTIPSIYHDSIQSTLIHLNSTQVGPHGDLFSDFGSTKGPHFLQGPHYLNFRLKNALKVRQTLSIKCWPFEYLWWQN